MAVRSDAKRLYVADTEGFVRVWDMDRAIEIASIPDTGRNFALALSADGRILATGSESSQVAARLWNLNDDGLPSSKTPIELVGPTGMLSAVAISPDGKTVFTGTVKQTSGVGTLWDAATGRELATVPRLRARINAAVFSKDGNDLFVASDDSAVVHYNIAGGDIVRTFPLSGYVTDLSLSDDGQQLLTVNMVDSAAGARSRITIWTVPAWDQQATQKVLAEAEFTKRSPPTPDDEILSARFMPGGKTAVSVHRSHDRRTSQARLWNLADPAKPVVERVLRIPKSIPAADLVVAIHDPKSNADKLLSLHLDSVFQWNLRTLTHELSFRQAAAITEAAFSPDAKWIATGSRSIVLWDAASRKSVGKLEYPHEGAVSSVNWDPSMPGRFASGGNDGKVRLWTMSEAGPAPKAIATLDAGSGVKRVRWSHDGHLLAVCEDGRARVWNVAKPESPPQVYSSGESSPLLSGQFSPRGDAIMAGSNSGFAYVWKLDAADRSKPWAVLRGHADAVEDVGFLSNPDDPNGELRYLTASRDKSARLWSILDVSGLSPEEPVRVREVLALRKHDLGVTAIQATPDGRTLMTASLDGRVILWPTGDTP
jgi:WD40 repeat protein